MTTCSSFAEPVPESLVEIFNAIHQFPTSADFASWLTDSEFNHHVYENKVEEGKYKRTYHYDFDGHIFFQGKAELELSYFPARSVQALMNKSLPSLPVFNRVGKDCISRVYVEPYYTVISYGLYKMEIVGMVWEIYNLNHISTIYKIKNMRKEYEEANLSQHS